MTESMTYTIEEFCEAFKVSRSTFYVFEKQGLMPRMMQVGRRRLITKEAAQEWVKRMEEAHQNKRSNNHEV